MKTILAVLFVLFLTVSAFAAGPFLVANPQQGIDYFVVTGLPPALDGSHVVPDASGQYAFKFDLSALPTGGPYTVKATACSNTWGCSADSGPFVFTRPTLTVPASLNLAK